PMAFHLPRSEFVGVDASERQVSEARAVARTLGLRNVRLEHASILDVGASWGEFDYVVCHGVFSWVSEEVQDKILAIAAERLRPQGIAYVSYNTYPGWHVRGAVRHMMRYHADPFRDVSERIGQARALLEFLASNVDPESYYGAALQSELTLVSRVGDSYLFHDHLEEVNAPLYFHEFVGRADRHGLRYLAEADFSTMLTSGFPETTAETLERISPDLVHAEQYMDFLRNRFFRQTLLCGAGHDLQRRLSGSNLEGLLLASAVVPDGTSDQNEPGFRMPDGRRVATTFPLTHAVLEVLGEHWPQALDQETLSVLARERLPAAPDRGHQAEGWEVVREDMLHCYTRGAIELRTWQAPCMNRVSERPEVSRLAAAQARGDGRVTNQRHEPVSLDVVGRHLARMLDGTRDRAA
ncbi:MAG TPA: class I SAM-dependent methyltransferase, partial [Longimicrobiales bacterium]|nr:class I SAM-dependent methyltransferase [Longimicrobiales bacterium]